MDVLTAYFFRFCFLPKAELFCFYNSAFSDFFSYLNCLHTIFHEFEGKHP